MALTYKHCSACGGGPWPPQRFYRAAKRKDGSYRYTGRCRVCIIKAVRENEDTKAEHYKAKKQERAKRPEYVAARKRYLQTERGREVMRESRRAWQVTHPEQDRAIQKRWHKISSERRRERRQASRRVTSATQPHTTDAPAHKAE